MKRFLTVGLMLAMSTSAIPAANATQLLYLASQNDKTIVAYEIDAQSGKLKPRSRFNLPGNPGPLAFSPDGAFIYAAMTGLEGEQAGVATLARGQDGSLTLKGTATLASRAPYIRTSKDGKLLLAAHYGVGDVTVNRITNGICTSELLDQKTTEKTAHCIELDPSGRFVFVPHTSPNKVYQFVLDAKTGKLTPNNPPFAVGPDKDHRYHEPRHYVHSPKLNVAYTSNENGGGITAWKFDPQQGTLTKMQTLSTLPKDFDGQSAAADIHITPNGRFVYVSNRDVTKRGEGAAMHDSLAGFSIDPESGKLKRIGHFPTNHFPRSFCIDLTGKFVYAAGQLSSDLFAYRIDQKSGKLKQLATYETGAVPIWVMCGEAEK